MRISMAKRWAEGLGAGVGVALFGLLRPADPTFAGASFLPQALVAIMTASFLGAAPGAWALVGASLTALVLSLIGPYPGPRLAAGDLRALFDAARIPAAIAIGCVLATGWLRDAEDSGRIRLFRRIRDLVHKNVQLKKMNGVLSSLSEELERRVSGQRDSVSALYSRVMKMDSTDIDKVLTGFLEAIVAFSQASAATVYEYDAKAGALILKASLGPGEEEHVPLEGTVEGWVFRYNSLFSLRMVGERINLANVDVGRSVLAYPLKMGELPWGVLNIREMPFYRYNLITEKNIGVIVNLASSYIKQAVDFRERAQRLPRNEITGLPGFDELLGRLREELELRTGRGLSVALVIVELLGFERLESARSKPKAFSLLKRFAEASIAEAGSRAFAYHFRQDGQLAFILPDLDRNGASLFGLDLTKSASSIQWMIDGEDAYFEIAIGLSAFPGSSLVESVGAEAKVNTLVAEAESILTISRQAFYEHGDCRS
jgi:hypothetical protein